MRQQQVTSASTRAEGAGAQPGLTSDAGGAGTLQTALLHTHQGPTVHKGTVRSTAGGIESLSVVW